MRAVVLRDFGRAPELADVPEPANGAAIATVLATTITPVDHVVAAGQFAAPAVLPMIAGKEGVAEIVSGTDALAAGTRVYFEFPPNRGGAFAERIALAPDDFVVDIGGTDPFAAAALGGSTGITAWTALTFTGQLSAGETVIVLGATGPVGLAAVAIAKILGAGRVVAVGRNATQLERARAAGADELVDASGDANAVTAALRDATGGGAHLIFDTVSGPIARAAFDSARFGARLVQVGRASGEHLTLPPSFMAKGLRAAGYANFLAPPEIRKANYRAILEQIERGTLRAEYRRRPLAEFADAWTATKSSSYGRFLLEPRLG